MENGKVDNTFRKTWDKEKYEKLARERVETGGSGNEGVKKQNLLPAVKKNLERREKEVELATNLGKTRVISLTAVGSEQAGYYCDACDLLMKDSVAYMDHLNSKKHQRVLGMSMKVQQSTLKDVRDKLSELKRKREIEKKKKKKTTV